MKILKYLFALSISLSFGNILADDFECRSITGNVELFPAPDGTCPILREKAKRFPDLTFLYEVGFPEPSCFVGELTGTLGDTPINGSVISGLTVNTLGLYPGTFLTAASAIRIHDAENGKKLGKVFTKDSILVAQEIEYLVLTEGTRRFKGAEGNFEIEGNAILDVASFTGTLCLED